MTLFKYSMYSVATFLGGLILMFVLLIGTATGREWLIATALPALLSLASINLDIDQVSSPSLSRLSINTLSLSVDEEKLLSTEGFYLEIDASELKEKRLAIRELKTSKFELNLDALASDDKSDTDFDIEEALNHLFPLSIQKFSIAQLQLTGSDIELPALSLNGKGALMWENIPFEADLTVNWQSTNTPALQLNARLNEQLNGQLTLLLNEQQGGRLSALLGFPADQALSGKMSLHSTSTQEGLALRLDTLEFPWYSHQIKMQAVGNWSTHERLFTLIKSELVIDGHAQAVSGWWQDQAFKLAMQLSEMPLGMLDRFQDWTKGGSLNGAIQAQGNMDQPEIHASISAVTTLKGQATQVKLSAKGNAERLEIEQANIRIGKNQLIAHGAILANAQTLDLNIEKLNGPVSVIRLFDADLPDGLAIEVIETKGRVFGDILSPTYSGQTRAKGTYLNKPFDLAGRFEGNIEKIKLSQSQLTQGSAKLLLNGLIDWHHEKLALTVDAQQLPDELLSWNAFTLPEGLKFTANAQGKISGTFEQISLDTKLSGNGTFHQQPLKASTKLSGNLKKLSFSELSSSLGNAQLLASGNLDLNDSLMDIAIKEFSADQELLTLAKQTFPTMDWSALPEDLIFSFQLNDAKLNGPFDAFNYSGQASLTAKLENEPLTLNTQLKGNFKQVTLSNLMAEYDQGKLEASGKIDWQAENLDLALTTEAWSLAFLKPLSIEIPATLAARTHARGSLKGPFSKLAYDGELKSVGEYRSTQFNVQSTLSVDPETLNIASFTAQLADLQDGSDPDNAPYNTTITASGNYAFINDTVKAHIKADNLPYHLLELADIALPGDLSGVLNADLSVKGKLPFPIVSGSMNSQGIFNQAPFTIKFTGFQEGKMLIVHDLHANWLNSALVATGELSEELFDLSLKLDNFMLSDLNNLGWELPPGNLSVQMDLMGTPDAPHINGLIELALPHNLKPYAQQSKALQLSSRVKTLKQRLMIDTVFKETHEAQGQLRIDTSLPYLLSWLFNQQDTENAEALPLDIRAQGNIGLAWINHFIDKDIQNLSGELILDAQVTGNVAQPRGLGTLELVKGHYKNALSQTELDNIEIKLALTDQAIDITHARAQDGLQGKLNLEGRIDLAKKPDGEADLLLTLDQASLLRREDIEGEASGQIRLKGDLKQLKLYGNLDVSPFQIMLDLVSTDTIPEITVSAISQQEKDPSRQLALPEVKLDLKVNVDQQAFIRGRGLDAELKGELKLTGTLEKPNYNGKFQVVRGNVELFAKNFKLEEGNVLFSNEAVSLFAQARHRSKDISFIASLSGTLDDLSINLRSEPALPEDEAVARLLFGKSVKNMTPVQAIQLANAIQTLRGGSSQFDPLGKARDILQVDRLTIESQETSEGSGVAIGLGKYVTDKVYVELTRTPEPTQPWKGSVEVELSPSVNLETTTSGNSGFGGVELQWKNDY